MRRPNECWKGGILYYNPNDSAIFVGRRDGAGFTLNMANPWSWAVLGSPLLLMASGWLVGDSRNGPSVPGRVNAERAERA